METWLHDIGGASGLNWSLLGFAVICFIAAKLSSALRLPGAVCGGFYVFSAFVDYSFGPPPEIWNVVDHKEYYLAFITIDLSVLFAVIFLKRYWAAWVQFAMICSLFWVLFFPHGLIYNQRDHIWVALNALFVTFLIFEELFVWAFREHGHRITLLKARIRGKW